MEATTVHQTGFLIPSENLLFVLHLCWKFPDMDDTCFLPEHTLTVDFINTINSIARHIQPSAFTLILNLSYDEGHLHAFPDIHSLSKTLIMKLALYRCIIELTTPQLGKLGLRDLFVHISLANRNQL